MGEVLERAERVEQGRGVHGHGPWFHESFHPEYFFSKSRRGIAQSQSKDAMQMTETARAQSKRYPGSLARPPFRRLLSPSNPPGAAGGAAGC